MFNKVFENQIKGEMKQQKYSEIDKASFVEHVIAICFMFPNQFSISHLSFDFC